MGYIDLPVVGGGGSGITDLTGDVTATGPGSAAATVVQVGGETAADVATSVQDTQAATELATPDTLVKRGNTGNASFENVIGNTSLQATDGVIPKSTTINKDNLQITSTPDNRLITLDVTNNLIKIEDTVSADYCSLSTQFITSSSGTKLITLDATSNILSISDSGGSLVTTIGTTGVLVNDTVSNVNCSINNTGLISSNPGGAFNSLQSNILQLGNSSGIYYTEINCTVNDITTISGFGGPNPHLFRFAETNGYASIVEAVGFQLKESGVGVGTFTQYAPVGATSYFVTWPANQANANEVLQNDGAGNLSWVAPSGMGLPVQAGNEGKFLVTDGTVPAWSSIVNDQQLGANFQAKGNTDANLLFVDAINDKVGIGTASPAEKLQVSGNARADLFISTDGANLSATMDYTNGVQITNSGTANSILTSNSLNINDGASSAILAATSVSFIANGGNTAASLDAITPAVNVESAVSNFRSTLSSGVLELYSDKNTPFYLSINGTTTDQATFTLVGTGVLDPYFYFNSSNNPNVFVQTGSFKADLAIGTNAVLNHTNLIFSDTSAGTSSTISFTTPNLYLTTSNGEVVVTANDLSIDTAGKGLKIKEGTDAKMGVATLTAGTVTVATQAVTANSRIFLTVQSLGTITTPVAVAVTARTANTDFTITSADNTDTSEVAWMIVEPA